MSYLYSKNHDINKTRKLYNAIDSTIIENRDYREIFDNAIEFRYDKPLYEYRENIIDSIIVNEIRHNCSNYDQILKQIHRIDRSGNYNDYIQYKNSVLDKISKVYPFLKDECIKQKSKLDMVKICE